MWDPEGRHAYDFLSAYSAVKFLPRMYDDVIAFLPCVRSQGHCHPKIIDALVNQARKLTISSRAFYNDKFAEYLKFTTEFFGYEMLLPSNSGVGTVASLSFSLSLSLCEIQHA